ncbi:peptidoglycan-binding domain-containing protein [Pelagibacterium limicola]|uniref:peptidoglycan-binding domain-containing protein n=1 Tax=Pelagibacterium limicola TaxID=2791022 RepID=UPI0018AFD567|nr:peptidoglycan-binding domain-containing protein [Pelagibacterium limicola]
MTNIPLAIGAGLAGLAVRGGHWCFDRMVRSPMGSTAFMLAAGLTLMAGTNAMFLQEMRHPAPMFSAGTPAPAAVPVPPPVRPVIATPAEETAATTAVPAASPASTPAPVSVAAQSETPAPTGIGNADIAELQEKLKAMGLFDGTVDGYYGPKTADAIRSFEQRHGLPRTGAASPQVMQAVRNATANTSQAPQPAAATPAAAPVASQAEQAELDTLIAGLDAGAVAPTAAAVQPEREVVAQAVVFDPASAASAPASVPPALDRELVSEIQRGLSRLGFLQAPVDGIAGETTALAIRKFQVFNNFPATGEVSPAVRDMLVAAGAYI